MNKEISIPTGLTVTRLPPNKKTDRTNRNTELNKTIPRPNQHVIKLRAKYWPLKTETKQKWHFYLPREEI